MTRSWQPTPRTRTTELDSAVADRASRSTIAISYLTSDWHSLPYSGIADLAMPAADKRYDMRWKEYYAALRHYKDVNGHCNVSDAVRALDKWLYSAGSEELMMHGMMY